MNTRRDSAKSELSPGEAVLLHWLIRCPFVSARDLATLTGVHDTSTVLRRLGRLEQRGLVEYVVPSSALLSGQRLYYLADQGVRLGALLAGEPQRTFARRWGLGERALALRLHRLDHLVLTRGLLIDLLREAPRAGESVLCSWRPWPLRWHYRDQGGRPRAFTLDGAGLLGPPDPPIDAQARGAGGFVLLWDQPFLDVEALRPRLRAIWLATTRNDPLQVLVPAPPAVLLVAAGTARAHTAHRLARAVAHAQDFGIGPPLGLLTAAQVDVICAQGPLAVPWRGADGHERPLLVALTSLGQQQQAAESEHGVLLPPMSGTLGRTLKGGQPIWRLVRGHFAARAQALSSGSIDSGGSGCLDSPPNSIEADNSPGSGRSGRSLSPRGEEGGEITLALISLGLRPREERALRCIGLQPLLIASQVAELVQDAPKRIRRTLARLRALTVIEAVAPSDVHMGADHIRYLLTPHGLRLLAARAGLAPRDYLRYTGSIAGSYASFSALSVPSAPLQGLPKDRAESAHGEEQGSHLAWMMRFAAHTSELQGIYLAFVRTARASHGMHRLEEWRGEWAAKRRFFYDGAYHVLRPDSYVRYHVGKESLSCFIELDRGRYEVGAEWQRKMERYLCYRSSGVWTRTDPIFPTLLVVTTGEGRLRTLLTLAGEVAMAFLAPPLPVRVATAADLAQYGPLAPIWRAAIREPPGSLFVPGPTHR